MAEPAKPGDLTADAALLLLKLGGATSSFEAGHVAAALARHRKAMRLEGSGVPPVVAELERIFAAIAMGSRGLTAGQDVAELARSDEPQQRSPHEDDHLAELLTREQVGRRLRCSVATVKRRERDGVLTPVRHGRVVRHRREDIDRLIREGA